MHQNDHGGCKRKKTAIAFDSLKYKHFEFILSKSENIVVNYFSGVIQTTLQTLGCLQTQLGTKLLLLFVSCFKELKIFVVPRFFQSVRSGSAWSKSSGKRRRGSTRRNCASLRSRSASSAPASKRLRSASAAARRREEPRRRQK